MNRSSTTADAPILTVQASARPYGNNPAPTLPLGAKFCMAVGAIMSMIMLISFTAAVDIYIHTKAAELNESKYK